MMRSATFALMQALAVSGQVNVYPDQVFESYLSRDSTKNGFYSFDINTGNVEWFYHDGTDNSTRLRWSGTYPKAISTDQSMALYASFSPPPRFPAVKDSKGKLIVEALSLATGSFLWSQDMPGIDKFGDLCERIPGANPSLASNGKHILVGSCKLLILEAATGNLKNSVEISGFTGAAFTRDGSMAYVTNPAGLHALRLSDGMLQWSLSTPSSHASPPILSADEAVIFFTELPGWVRAIEARNGKEIWSTTVGLFAVYAPALTHGSTDASMVLVTSTQGLEAFETSSGKRVWGYTMPKPYRSPFITEHGTRHAPAVFLNANGTALVYGETVSRQPLNSPTTLPWVAAVNTTNGAEVWQRAFGFGIIGTGNGKIEAIGKTTAALKWSGQGWQRIFGVDMVSGGNYPGNSWTFPETSTDHAVVV